MTKKTPLRFISRGYKCDRTQKKEQWNTIVQTNKFIASTRYGQKQTKRLLRMKFKRRYRILILLILVVLFRGALFRLTVSYRIIEERKTNSNCSSLSSYFQNIDTNKTLLSCQKRTAQLLSFSAKNSSKDPTKIAQNGFANCIGYAKVFAAMVNCVEGQRFKAKPVKAKLYFLGFDVHKLFNSPFFSNHDIVIVTDAKTGTTLAFDPSLYDYTGISYVNISPASKHRLLSE